MIKRACGCDCMLTLFFRRILPILLGLLYLVSPVDAVPDFLPGVGWVDDLLVLAAVAWYLYALQQGRSPWDFFSTRPGRSRTRPSAGPTAEDLKADFDRMDPYALLEISPQASADEIKSAYKRAVARYHPDKVAHLGREFQELAHRKLLAIQRAYEMLQGPGR